MNQFDSIPVSRIVRVMRAHVQGGDAHQVQQWLDEHQFTLRSKSDDGIYEIWDTDKDVEHWNEANNTLIIYGDQGEIVMLKGMILV